MVSSPSRQEMMQHVWAALVLLTLLDIQSLPHANEQLGNFGGNINFNAHKHDCT